MTKLLLWSLFLLPAMPLCAITLDDVYVPESLSDHDVLELAEGFCADGNTESLNILALGIANSRDDLLDPIFQNVAQNCSSSADTLVFTIQENLPDIGLPAFAAMYSYLQENHDSIALTSLRESNPELLTQLNNQGLNIETAAGPEVVNFDTVLESLDISGFEN